jgi:ubiquinone/menaquinone biosynthesis C-methylase UbiE
MFIAEQGIDVTGVDLSTIGVKRAREGLKHYPGSHTLVANVHHLPFRDESFDSLISNRVLDYNDDEGLEAAFSEIERVTKAGSPILLTLRSSAQPPKNNEQLLAENDAGGKTFLVTSGRETGAHQHYFTRSEIEALAQHHHCEIVEINELRKTNKEGRFKAEWQIVLRKTSRHV